MTRLLTLLCALAGLAPAQEAPTTVRVAKGTRWETAAHVRTAPASGPTVMVVAGMHGDETAGRRAADQVRHWPITRGKLIVLPRANTLGGARRKRLVPDGKPYNLNRRFPSQEGKEPSGPLAKSIWSLVRKAKPDWLIDLHESVNYYGKAEYLGNTLICASGEKTKATAERMAAMLTRWNPRKVGKWVVLKEPIEGSLVRAAADRLKARAMMVETCRKDYLAIRIRHHRVLVHRLLSELGMLPAGFSPHTFFPPERAPGEIRVALYNTYGTGLSSAYDVERCLRSPVVPRRVTASAIKSGALGQFDVVVFPGGTATGSAKSLRKQGRDAVRKFVKEGGGYVGFCAGAYLATNYYSWSLHVLDSKVVDSKHWARGTGIVEMELTGAGRKLFDLEKKKVRIYYGQGPLLAPAESVETLATYRTEIAKRGAPKGVMAGTPAIVRSRYGQGRVLVISPHPEKTRGLGHIARGAVIWAARRPYNPSR